MEFTTVQTLFSDIEANLLKTRLEIAGFHPRLKDENATLFTAAPTTTGGIKLQVPSTEAADALAFIESEAEAAEDSSAAPPDA